MASDFEKMLQNAYEGYWEHTQDLSFIKDINGVYLRVSLAFAKMVGYDNREDVVGKTDAEIFVDSNLVTRYSSDDKLLLNGGDPIRNYIEPITYKNGRPRYSLTSKYALHDEQNRIIGICGIGRDVTVEYEAKKSYDTEIKVLFELPDDALATIMFDVTSWRMVDERYRQESIHATSHYEHIDDFFKKTAASVVDDEAIRGMLSHACREYFQNEYNSGRRNASYEYLIKFPDESLHWIKMDFHYLLDPVIDNLSLIIVIYDLNNKTKAHSTLAFAAEFDSMTELYNRDTVVMSIKNEILNSSNRFALFMIDLDNFKQINDTFGHQYGDKILSEVGKIIKNTFRKTDIPGRLGGDEFMILMKDVGSKKDVAKKTDELIAALQFSSFNGKKTIDLTTSIGVTVFSGGTKSFNDLYSEADSALYQAKRAGKNRAMIYSKEMKNDVQSAPLTLPDEVSTVQLRTLLDYMNGGVIMAEVDKKIKITYVSPSLYRSFQLEYLKNIKQDILSVAVEEDFPKVENELFRAANCDELIRFSFRVKANGMLQWWFATVKRIPEANDGIHRIVAAITDISGLKKANEQLLAAEERYRLAIEQTDAMLWEVELSTKTLTLISPSWEKFGFGKTVFPEAPDDFIKTGIIDSSSISEFRSMFDDMYAGVEGGVYYLKIFDESRAEIWIRTQFTIICSEDKTPSYALCTLQRIPNINAEMLKFEREIHFSDIVSPSLRGCVRANLTKNEIESVSLFNSSGYEFRAGTSFDTFINNDLKRFIAKEDFERICDQISVATLSNKFRIGEMWQFADHQGVYGNGDKFWICILIKLMRHPISGDIYAFGYLRDYKIQRSWERALGFQSKHDISSLLYTQSSFQNIAEYVIKSSPKNSLISMTVIELFNRDETNASTSFESGELLLNFGRLCWIMINGDVAICQLDDNKVAVLRMDVDSRDEQQYRVSHTINMLSNLIGEAHIIDKINIIAGYAIEHAELANYDTLLKKAIIACESAVRNIGATAIPYDETGIDIIDADNDNDIAEKYKQLELRYQKQVNLLRITENDELTGLLGKAAFYRNVRKTIDEHPENTYAIVRFDINRFKVYNDVHGTAAGDSMLIELASHIPEFSKSIIYSARLVSDHFVLLIPDDMNEIEKLKKTLIDSRLIHASDFHISFSIGVYIITDQSLDVSLMCDRALLALRSVKTGFETRLAYFDNKLRDRLIDEQQLIRDMETALIENQFVVYFQPQINYESGMLIGAEALVRWEHPQRGLLFPASFIPLFEQNGLIIKLDEYVWDKCCRYIKDWTERFPQAKDLSVSVSVNVSRLDIYDPLLTQTLKNMIEKYGLEHSSLRLEITESAYMDDPGQLMNTVRSLKNAGFSVEMDDFGSGYSSLNTLKDVDVDVLKLDMKFLAECTDNSRSGNILSSVIRMANWLKLPLIAEGVETKEQADYLKSLGCIYMQGYYFDRPMPVADFEKLLVSGAAAINDKYKTVNLDGAAAFWDPSAQMTLLFNSFVGGAAIMEFRDGTLEAVRTNDAFYKTLGTTREKYLPYQQNILLRFDDENRVRLVSEIKKAIETGEECGCELKSIYGMGGVVKTWTSSRIRLLAKNGNSSLLYISVEDISDRKRMEEEQKIENERNRLMMETTGTGLFDYNYDEDQLLCQGFSADGKLYTYTVPSFLKKLKNNRSLDLESSKKLRNFFLNFDSESYSGEIEIKANLWKKGMRWYRFRYAAIIGSDGKLLRIISQADDIQLKKDREVLSKSIESKLNGVSNANTFNDTLVDQILGLFYGSHDIGSAIETTLELLIEYYDLSRAYVLENVNNNTAFSNTFEACAEGIQSEKDNLQNISYSEIGGKTAYISKFDNRGIFFCPDISMLPLKQREILEPHSVKSMFHCAIRDNGVFSGIVGFDECNDGRRWTDELIGTLLVVSRIIGSFILRMKETINAELSSYFKLALDNNSAFIYIINPKTYEIIYINDAIKKDTGDSILGKKCYQEFIGRSVPCNQCPVRGLHVHGKLHSAEVLRADGLTMFTHASPMRWNGMDMAMLSCIDITESKRVSQELLLEKQKTEYMLAVSQIHLWTYDISKNIIVTSAEVPPFFCDGLIKNSYNTVVEKGLILPESVNDFIYLHEKIKSGATTASADINFNPEKCKLNKLHIEYNSVFDIQGKPTIAIAFARPID